MNYIDIVWCFVGIYLSFIGVKYLINNNKLISRFNVNDYKNINSFGKRICISLIIIGVYFIFISIYKIINKNDSILYYIIGAFLLCIFTIINQNLSKTKKKD